MTSLLTSGAMAFGRLLLVNIMPSAILVLSIWLAARGLSLNRSTYGASRVDDAATISGSVDSTTLTLIVFAIAAFAAVLNNFQFPIIRLFEGYWGTKRPWIRLYSVNVLRHRRKRELWKQQSDEWRGKRTYWREESEKLLGPHDTGAGPPSCQRQREILREKIRSELTSQTLSERIPALYPPMNIELLPTSLGNAMRSFEHRAGERYGYGTIATWPRLYPNLSDRLAAQLHVAIDSLHAAVNFTLVLLVAAPVLAVGFWNDIGAAWLPLTCIILAMITYRGGVAAAQSVGLVHAVSFDLHRFDMLNALHQKLPDDGAEEYDRANAITAFLEDPEPNADPARLADLSYVHKKKDEDKDKPTEKRS